MCRSLSSAARAAISRGLIIAYAEGRRVPSSGREHARRCSPKSGRTKRQMPFGIEHVHDEERPRLLRARGVFHAYGLTPEDEARLYERQNRKCGLCRADLATMPFFRGNKSA